MNLIVRISIRNLLRQKRRSILLGIAICFGMMILIVANSFSRGISDVLFNKIIAYAFGHVNINFTNGGNTSKAVFYNGAYIREVIKRTSPDIELTDEALGIFCRAISDSKADNIMLIGITVDPQSMDQNLSPRVVEQLQQETESNFKMVKGSFSDLSKTNIENPALISVEKAAALNVGLQDILRVRYTDIHGRNQACRLTIVGIFKPANLFMQSPVFVDAPAVKRLFGLAPHQITSLNLRVKNPKVNARKVADSLYAKLASGIAAIQGSLQTPETTLQTRLFGFRTDSLSLGKLKSSCTLLSGEPVAAFGKNGIILSAEAADKADLFAGDSARFTYVGLYDSTPVTISFLVDGVVKAKEGSFGDLILMNEKLFYSYYYEHWPKGIMAQDKQTLKPALTEFLAPQWILLDRYRTTKEATKMYRQINQKKWKATTIAVASMYEAASDALMIEQALNMITVSAVIILFFIILIGVINTLRMAIRERTREIGTIRAIGMQKNDVRNSFLCETLLLSFFASSIGVVLAFLSMWGLSLPSIETQDNPLGMLLINGHIHFTPSVAAIVLFVILILLITSITAYFPASRAANMSAVEALRHYE